MPQPVIVGYSRTPFGRYRGSLARFSAIDLGSKAICGLMDSLDITPADGHIDAVYMGMVLQGGAGQAPARQACLGAGLPVETPATTVNKVCGSSLKAVMIAAMEVESGRSKVVIAGGMESMTNAPFIAQNIDKGNPIEQSSLISLLQKDGLTDAFSGDHMGISGETIATEEGVDRNTADMYALNSHRRASHAWSTGWFDREVVPMECLDRDEGIRDDTSLSKLADLNPVFKDGGVVTAGNSSQLSDGAAAVMVCSKEVAEKMGWPIIADIIDFETSGVSPSRVMSAPIPCIESLLTRNDLTVEDIDLFEHNEAFATASCGIKDHFNVDEKRFNIHGGAIAIGHPLGASGARCLMSLLNSMERTNGKKGIVTLCLGGGNAVGMLLSRDPD